MNKPSNMFSVRYRNGYLEFSKYLLKYLFLAAIVAVFILPKLIRIIRFDKTTGTVDHFTFYNGYRRTYYYPVVYYQVKDSSYLCVGNNMEKDELFVGDNVNVLYDPGNPDDGYLYTFIGYWGSTIVITVPCFLVATLLFGIDTIPNTIRIKWFHTKTNA
ncbi:MAG: hypothetical protein JST86_12005 [Bacteroidetes bacterium]|nr:hypothetical protein [Bacteroidota bacterium]